MGQERQFQILVAGVGNISGGADPVPESTFPKGTQFHRLLALGAIVEVKDGVPGIPAPDGLTKMPVGIDATPQMVNGIAQSGPLSAVSR